MKKSIKIIIAIILVIANIIMIDTLQAVLFNNAPLLSIKSGNIGKRYNSLFVTTYLYCDGSEETRWNFKVYLFGNRYRGCEGDSAEEIIKTELEASRIDFITDVLKASAPTIEKMYRTKSFTEEEAYLSALAIEGVAGCKMQDEFNKQWQTTEEFYDLWKKSKCRKENYERYSISYNYYKEYLK